MFRSTSLILSLSFLFSCVPMKGELSFRAPSEVKEKAELKAYTSELQMASRSYIESVLLQVFDAQGTAMATEIENVIYKKIEFGGACDQYEASDKGSATLEYPRAQCVNAIGVVQKSTNNPMRYSLTTKVCEKMVGDTARMDAVRNKIFADKKWAKPNDESVENAWELFYPTTKIDAQLRNNFINMRKIASTDQEAWKYIMLTLCISPEWQTLAF